MNELLEPASGLGELESLLEKSKLELEKQDAPLNEKPKYDAKRLVVGEKKLWAMGERAAEQEAGCQNAFLF